MSYAGPPALPTIRIGRIDESSVQVLWHVEDNTACGIVTYYVKIVVASNELQIKQDTTRNQNYEFTGLSPNTFYIVSVYGSNQAGDGATEDFRIQTVKKSNNNNNGNGMYDLIMITKTANLQLKWYVI